MYSNRYIFIYATVMVIIVAVTLSFIATYLKPYQEANVKTEKVKNILSSIQVQSDDKNAQELYKKHITKEILVKNDGTSTEGKAFDISLKAELKKAETERGMPLYVAEKEGKTFYIVPLWGRGLWGPIWGYISFEADINTVYGAIFDHKGETPGLGAEIADKNFQIAFTGKKIFDESGAFVSVKVVKGGAPEGDPHGVDAISGGTITCDGVTDMLNENLNFYTNYFKNIIKQ